MRIAGNIPHRARPTPASSPTPHRTGGTARRSTAANAEHAQRCCARAPRIRLDDGYLPTDLQGFEVTGFNESWWLGLSAMHTLFAREHNPRRRARSAPTRTGTTSASTRPRG